MNDEKFVRKINLSKVMVSDRLDSVACEKIVTRFVFEINVRDFDLYG